MRVFKFGGASVKDAKAIENVSRIIESYIQKGNPIITVISAIGKSTNKLENIVRAVADKNANASQFLSEIVEEHCQICKDLGFQDSDSAIEEIKLIERELSLFITTNESTNYNFIYDQIVSKGEILSTKIVFSYMIKKGIHARFINARNLIKTDHNYTDANILWQETETAVQNEIKDIEHDVIITQGFIGANSEMLYTTLGREGSDYTAAILAKCTGTKEMTIWKDVNGVYTADPKKFPEATIIPKLSYKEAIEMTFYGAQIIHPKTIKPIQNSNCILKVKSFLDTSAPGTEIGNFENIAYQPVIVHKDRQILYTFSVKDYSFLNETNLGKIIAVFGKYSLRINLMQNTAIEFCVSTDEKIGKNELIVEELKNDFEIQMYRDLEMLTIRHFTEEIRDRYIQNKHQILAQKNENTVQYLLK